MYVGGLRENCLFDVLWCLCRDTIWKFKLHLNARCFISGWFFTKFILAVWTYLCLFEYWMVFYVFVSAIFQLIMLSSFYCCRSQFPEKTPNILYENWHSLSTQIGVEYTMPGARFGAATSVLTGTRSTLD